MTHLHGGGSRLRIARHLATAPSLVLPAMAVGLLGMRGAAASGADELGPWPQAQAQAWYERRPWLVGANYVPATAANEFEMWQAETFDPASITVSSVGPKPSA